MGTNRAPLGRVVLVVLAAAAIVFVATRWSGDIEVGDLGLARDGASTTAAVGDATATDEVVEQSSLVCPGPERVGLADSTVAEGEQAISIAARAAPADALPGGISSEGGNIEVQTTDGMVVANTEQRAIEAAATIDQGYGAVAEASGSLAPALSAAQIYLGDQDGQLGLALTSCAIPQDESWLVAGGGQAGHAELLVLINPGQGPITAAVTLYGLAVDPTDGQSSTEVALEPGAREIVLLDALAPAEAAPVIRVESSGGPVSAFLGDRLLAGTTDMGTELTSPVASPATEQIIVGFDVPQGAADSAKVRVAVPGQEQAVIEVRALTADGSVALAQDVTLVASRRSADIAVSDLPEATYALAISGDEDFVAAAQVRSAADDQGRQDLAWAPGATPLGSIAGTPLPQVSQASPIAYTLDLFAPTGGRVRLISVDDQGILKESMLEVIDGQVLTHDLESATGVWLVPEPDQGQIYGAVRGEVQVTSRPADDALTLDEANSTPALERGRDERSEDEDERSDDADEPAGRAEVTLSSVLPLRELSLFRSVTSLTPALP